VASEDILPVKSSWRYLWIILPLLLGLLGGFIVYFILRKRDKKTANICLLVGLGISVVWTIGVLNVNRSPDRFQEEVPNEKIFIEKTQEEKIAEQKIADQRDAENKRIYQELQREAERQKELQSKFDPIIVQSALENIPDMLALPKEILKQCKAVKSYSDYLIFATAVAVMGEDLTQIMYEINVVLSALELEGYDKHPKVGPLIRETRSVAGETSDCLTDLVSRYEN